MSTQCTTIKYNRTGNSWQAVNGETVDFGPGPAGKRQALLAALQHDYPHLHQLVTDLAASNGNTLCLLDRLLKGAQLLAEGHVLRTWRENIYKVRSQGEDVLYRVKFAGIPATYTCTCADYENGLQRRAGLAEYGGVDVDFNLMPVCKHVLAVHLAWLTKWPLEDEPIPWGDREFCREFILDDEEYYGSDR